MHNHLTDFTTTKTVVSYTASSYPISLPALHSAECLQEQIRHKQETLNNVIAHTQSCQSIEPFSKAKSQVLR